MQNSSITAFADDLNCCESFPDETQLQGALKRIGILLDTLEEMGLQLSLDKSHVLINICGTNSRHVMHRIVHVDALGPYIEIPMAHGVRSRLPVRTSAKYLGVTVGYKMFETCTVQARMHAAKTTFSGLRRWLCARQIPLKFRLHMWQSCVFSTVSRFRTF